jgi:transposase
VSLYAIDDGQVISDDRGQDLRNAGGYYRELAESGAVVAVIPERRDQIANGKRRGSRGGRPHAFDALTYRQCNLGERCIGKLKQWCAIATRFYKLASRYLAGVTIASLILWLRHAE